MPTIDEDLAEVRRLVFRRLRGFDVEVYLFGSRAKGGASRSSDIDIAILPAVPLPAGLLSELRSDLEECRIPYKVELVDLSTTDNAFRECVRREGVQWAA